MGGLREGTAKATLNSTGVEGRGGGACIGAVAAPVHEQRLALEGRLSWQEQVSWLGHRDVSYPLQGPATGAINGNRRRSAATDEERQEHPANIEAPSLHAAKNGR